MRYKGIGERDSEQSFAYDPFYALALYVQKHFMNKENIFQSMLRNALLEVETSKKIRICTKQRDYYS